MLNSSRVIVGFFLNLEAWTIFLMNIFVLTCIVKSRLFASKDSSVYMLSSFNIGLETCQLALHVIYVGPSIITGKWFFDGQASLGVTIAAVWFLGFWYLGSLAQILFATNRITPDQEVFSYAYLDAENHTFNPSMFYVDLPLDIGTSSYCGVSYIALFVYIVKMNTGASKVGRRELRCCIQFLLMFLAYTIAWVTFFVFPVAGLQTMEAYVITPVLAVINGGINSIIFLTLNKEVRGAANRLIGREIFANAVAATQTGTHGHSCVTPTTQNHPH